MSSDEGRVIDWFRFEHAFLSNFAPAPVTYDGVTYPTVEHAFQAAKTLGMTTRALILAAPTPDVAQRVGRTVNLRPDWADVRVTIMRDLLRQKFAAPMRRRALLATGDAVLIEGNTWHHQFWGDCRCGREGCAEPGLNMLGRLLTEVRAELRVRSGGAP